jgi:hypothetical protein
MSVAKVNLDTTTNTTHKTHKMDVGVIVFCMRPRGMCILDQRVAKALVAWLVVEFNKYLRL